MRWIKVYKQAIIDVTGKCNINCRHCYAASKYGKHNRIDMSLDTVLKTIDLLKDSGYTHILFLGGEPLFREDILKIINYTIKKNLKVMINTNGILLDENMCTELIELGVEQISVSFEGTVDKIHDLIAGQGNFNKTLLGLRTLIKTRKKLNSNIFIGIQYTISKISVNDAENVINFALRENVDGVNINFLDDIGNANKNKDDIGITINESINFIEDILKVCNKICLDNGFVIQIPAKRALIRYLNHKFRVNIEEGPLGFKCTAGDKVILIENDGVVTPCGIVNNLMYQNSITNKNLNHQILYIFDYKNQEELNCTDYFRSFNLLKEKGSSCVCNECRYNNDCRPCPINPEKDIEQCKIAKLRYEKFLDNVLKLPVTINIEKISNLKMNNTAYQIVNLFLENYSIEEVVKFMSYKANKKENDILDDVIDFHYLLSINGLIV